MRKLFAILSIVLATVTVSTAQVRVYDVPVKIGFEKTKCFNATWRTDTVVKTNRVKVDRTTTITGFMYESNSKDKLFKTFTCADGHQFSVSVWNNLTLVDDIVGTVYNYMEDSLVFVKVPKEVCDTVWYDCEKPVSTDLLCLSVRKEYWNNGSFTPEYHYFARIYSYSTGKIYTTEVTELFWNRHGYKDFDMPKSKRQKIAEHNTLSYSDYRQILWKKDNTLVERKYNITETF